jgi:hypothetical protein
VPRVIITDRLKSDGTALREVLPSVEHGQDRSLKNRRVSGRRALQPGLLRCAKVTQRHRVIRLPPTSSGLCTSSTLTARLQICRVRSTQSQHVPAGVPTRVRYAPTQHALASVQEQ